MNYIEQIRSKARSLNKTIVLPEGNDKRVVKAAEIITKEGIAKVVLLGDKDEIFKIAEGADLSNVEIINPKESPKLEEYALTCCKCVKRRA